MFVRQSSCETNLLDKTNVKSKLPKKFFFLKKTSQTILYNIYLLVHDHRKHVFRFDHYARATTRL